MDHMDVFNIHKSTNKKDTYDDDPFKQRLTKMQERIMEMENESSKMRDRYTEHIKQLEDKLHKVENDYLNKLEREQIVNADLMRKNEYLEQSVIDKESKIDQLKKKIKSNINISNDKMIHDIGMSGEDDSETNLMEEYEKLQIEYDRLNNDYTNMQTFYTHAVEKISKVKEKNKDLNKENEEMKSLMKMMEEKFSRTFEELKQEKSLEIKQLRERNQEQNQHLSTLKEEILNLKTKLSNLEIEKKQMLENFGKHHELIEERDELEKKYNTSLELIGEKVEKMEEMEQALNTYKSLYKQQINVLCDEIQSLKDENERLKKSQ